LGLRCFQQLAASARVLVVGSSTGASSLASSRSAVLRGGSSSLEGAGVHSAAIRAFQHTFDPAAAGIGHQQHGDALAAGAAGAAGAMLQALGVMRQIDMDDEADMRQIDAARRDVGGDADARAPVAQRLKRLSCARSGHARPTAARRRSRAPAGWRADAGRLSRVLQKTIALGRVT
jgi:hypothetical protein